MPHELKLSTYILRLSPTNKKTENINRTLFEAISGEKGHEDTSLFLSFFQRFIKSIDTEEMFSDDHSKKCFTAYQPDIEDNDTEPNINVHMHSYIIEGLIEGGLFGRKRSKTSISNKNLKSDVREEDAITDHFYFLLFTPPHSNKSILFVQSYTDITIDTVVKKFFEFLFTYPSVFYKPKLQKYIPKSFIEKFKKGASISELTFTEDIVGETLLDESFTENDQRFKITIKIEPVDENLSYNALENRLHSLAKTVFQKIPLGSFSSKKGTLKSEKGRTTRFDIDSDFEIQPSILLSDYIELIGEDSDFKKIKDFCLEVLEEVKQEIYHDYAVQEY